MLEATQELAAAEQDLDGAVLEAPISGRVGQVDLVEGEQASTSSGVVLVGPGAAVVTVDLPLAQLGKVRVAPGRHGDAGRHDRRRCPAWCRASACCRRRRRPPPPPTRCGSRSRTPRVTLAAGSTATVTITLATATDVLTVPVSAVTGVSSGTGSVQVLVRRHRQGHEGHRRRGRAGHGAGRGRPDRRPGRRARRPEHRAAERQQRPVRRSTTSGVSSLTGNTGPGGGLGGPPPG